MSLLHNIEITCIYMAILKICETIRGSELHEYGLDMDSKEIENIIKNYPSIMIKRQKLKEHTNK